MRRIRLAAALLALLPAAAADAAGLAYSDNFIVLAFDQPLANDVLDAAEGLRKQIATDWLGAELPAGKGRTGIGVLLSDTRDNGLTWPIDSPKRKIHRIWLRTSRDGAVSATLAHEITHVVFATHLLGTLPAWANEGIATLYDDAERASIRADVMAGFSRSGDWPDLAKVLDASRVSTGDRETYSVAVSLVEYLLTRGDKLTVVRFALAGRKQGWDAAARQHYGFRTVADLQAAWQAWAGRADRPEHAAATGAFLGQPPR